MKLMGLGYFMSLVLSLQMLQMPMMLYIERMETPIETIGKN
tara:strand:- start:503 stop:625 length:123 start_codon:yes stop_codon:yes gene_type:complete